jgi:hypothetical protein
VTASVEYPAGTFTQLLFSGSSSANITNGNYVLSDFASVNIPDRVEFFVRIYYTNAAGIIWTNGDLSVGEAMTYGVSGVIDQTMSGTVVTTAGGANVMRPLAILGYTRKPTAGLVGDSIVQLGADTLASGIPDLGELARSIGSSLGYLNLAVSGEQLMSGSINKRLDFLACCTHIFNNYGINDFFAGKTAAQIITAQANLRGQAKIAGKPFYVATVTPRCTSTDSFATTGNQTKFSGDAERVSYNNCVRAGLSGVTGFFEMADLAESARDSGVWPVNGAANWSTADGVHPSQRLVQVFKDSGVVRPRLLR